MKSGKQDVTLSELLCLIQFDRPLSPLGSREVLKAMTEWAENAVISGNPSESLLILASFNLENLPDSDEVRDYLERFMRQSGIAYPSRKYSALVWLRVMLNRLIVCDSRQSLEGQLTFFIQNTFDDVPLFFLRTTQLINYHYYALFDDYGGECVSPAQEMSDQALLDTFHIPLRQIIRKLNNPDWLALWVNDSQEWVAVEP